MAHFDHGVDYLIQRASLGANNFSLFLRLFSNRSFISLYEALKLTGLLAEYTDSNRIFLWSKLIFILISFCEYHNLIDIYFLESKIFEISCSIIIDYQLSDKRLPVLA